MFYYIFIMKQSSFYVCKTKKDINEFYSDSSKKNGISSKCKKCANIRNRDKKKLRMKNDDEYRKLDNKKRESRKVHRESRDPVFKLKRKMRHSLIDAFRRKGYSKETQSQKILGADWKTVKEHFESLFTEGMNWKNMGKWHIDHIIPLSIAKTEEDIIKLCNYTNLQPLWAEDNLKKSNKII